MTHMTSPSVHCSLGSVCRFFGEQVHQHSIDPTAILVSGTSVEWSFNDPDLEASAKSLRKVSRKFCNFDDCSMRNIGPHSHGTEPGALQVHHIKPGEVYEAIQNDGGLGSQHSLGVELKGDDSPSNPHEPVRLEMPADASRELLMIGKYILPHLWDLFCRKNLGYQNDRGSAFELGIKGQYSDMHRKFMKLRRAMWEDQPLVGEQLDEILEDLVGHIWLTLVMLMDDELNEHL